MRIKIILILFFIGTLASNSFGQTKAVTISGLIKDKVAKTALSYVNIILKTEKDSTFITGTVSNEEGRFTLSNIKPCLLYTSPSPRD